MNTKRIFIFAALAVCISMPGLAAKPAPPGPEKEPPITRADIAATVEHMATLAKEQQAESDALKAENEKLKGFLSEATRQVTESGGLAIALQKRGDDLRSWGIGEQEEAQKNFALFQTEKKSKEEAQAHDKETTKKLDLALWFISGLVALVAFGLVSNISMKAGIIAGIIAGPACFALLRYIWN